MPFNQRQRLSQFGNARNPVSDLHPEIVTSCCATFESELNGGAPEAEIGGLLCHFSHLLLMNEK